MTRPERLVKDANMMYKALNYVQNWPGISHILDWLTSRKLQKELFDNGRWKQLQGIQESPLRHFTKNVIPAPLHGVMSNIDSSKWSDPQSARLDFRNQWANNTALRDSARGLRQQAIQSRAQYA